MTNHHNRRLGGLLLKLSVALLCAAPYIEALANIGKI